jgi:hypothetical protein
VTVDAASARSGLTAASRQAGLASVAAETVVVDHGKIYLSGHLMAVCERLGISVQPARPLTPTDKAAIERFFRTLREGLLAALPGYKGPDVYSRGADPEGCTYFFTGELEQVIREWVSGIYHRRPHAGLAEPQVPGLDLSPAEMFEAGAARTGRLRIPAHPGLVFDFLPVAWRTIQHYGIEVGGLRYDGPALTRYRNRKSPFTGVHAGKWPVRFDPDDVSKVYFQDPADHAWHELAWEHAEQAGAPFSAEALAYARRLALAEGRHVDERRALAELLDRWDAGLVRHPAERRMAIRASQQRSARLASSGHDTAAEVAALPAVAALAGGRNPPAPGGAGGGQPPDGDDDSPDELDADDEDFYADAFKVLPALRCSQPRNGTGIPPPRPAGSPWPRLRPGPARQSCAPGRSRRCRRPNGAATTRPARSGTPTSGRSAPRRWTRCSRRWRKSAAATFRTGTRPGPRRSWTRCPDWARPPPRWHSAAGSTATRSSCTARRQKLATAPGSASRWFTSG